MAEDAALDATFCRKLLNHLNDKPQETCYIRTHLLRCILTELSRFKESERLNEAEKVSFIQRLTMEFSYAHFAELINETIKQENEELTTDQVLKTMKHQVEEMRAGFQVYPEGTV
jgi:urease gamma subunit